MHYTFILEVRVNDPHYGDGDRPSTDTTYLSFRSVAYACNMFIIMDVSILSLYIQTVLLLRVIIIVHYILFDLTSDPSKRVADFTAMCQNVHTTTFLVSYTTEQQFGSLEVSKPPALMKLYQDGLGLGLFRLCS